MGADSSPKRHAQARVRTPSGEYQDDLQPTLSTQVSSRGQSTNSIPGVIEHD